MFHQVGTVAGAVLPARVRDVVKPIWIDVVERTRGEVIRDPTDRLMIAPSGVCNLGCRFCAYRHKDRPKRIMPDERFFGVVDQATQLGYEKFGLTPLTGEVYTDPDFLSKLSFLEAHPAVESYYFFTNLTLASHDDLRETLTDCETLKRGSQGLFVSVYGHDRDSFLRITGGEDAHYDRLVSNLKFLADFLEDGGNLEIGFRTVESVDPRERLAADRSAQNELFRAVSDLEALGVRVSAHTGAYNNWGGAVSAEDLDGLDMEVADAPVAKHGACQLVFNKNIVLPDGTVNACACRDVNATLSLGDTKDQPLADILSPSRNERYAALIERQQAGDFPDVCTTCDFYQSIVDVGIDEGYSLAEFHEQFDPATDGYAPTDDRGG